jgi:hypothetical protein
VRSSLFAWFSIEYHFRVKHQKVAVWNWRLHITGDPCGGHRENDQRKLLLAAADCIERAANYSWWDWADGSRPFFWRWSVEYHNQIRDEIPPWYRATAPQKKEKCTEVIKSMDAKLMTVFLRCYFIYGMILSLTSFFLCQKETRIFVWSTMVLHRA